MGISAESCVCKTSLMPQNYSFNGTEPLHRYSFCHIGMFIFGLYRILHLVLLRTTFFISI
jgi:hypothetical protein